MRYVKNKLVLRLKETPSDELLAEINARVRRHPQRRPVHGRRAAAGGEGRARPGRSAAAGVPLQPPQPRPAAATDRRAQPRQHSLSPAEPASQAAWFLIAAGLAASYTEPRILTVSLAGLPGDARGVSIARPDEWFVQHGGKQHGPMSSATLKRLASENKISPTTNVRLGTEATLGAGRARCEESLHHRADRRRPRKPASARCPGPPASAPGRAPLRRPKMISIRCWMPCRPRCNRRRGARVPVATAVPLPKALPVPTDTGSVTTRVPGSRGGRSWAWSHWRPSGCRSSTKGPWHGWGSWWAGWALCSAAVRWRFRRCKADRACRCRSPAPAARRWAWC